MLAKILALVTEKPVGEAQSCAIPGKTTTILSATFLDKTGRKPGMGGVLVHLEQSKTFNNIYHHFLEAVLGVSVLGLDIGHLW